MTSNYEFSLESCFAFSYSFLWSLFTTFSYFSSHFSVHLNCVLNDDTERHVHVESEKKLEQNIACSTVEMKTMKSGLPSSSESERFSKLWRLECWFDSKFPVFTYFQVLLTKMFANFYKQRESGVKLRHFLCTAFLNWQRISKKSFF